MLSDIDDVKNRIMMRLSGVDVSAECEKILRFYNYVVPPSVSGTEERKPWYYRSYPVFIHEAQKLRRLLIAEANANIAEKSEHLVTLTAFVMSWIAGIPRADFSDSNNLDAVCQKIVKIEGWSLEETRFLDAENIQSLHRKKAIKICNNRTPESDPIDLKKYIQLVKKMLSGQSDTTSHNLPTVSKFLHFVHPDMFPIFDSNIYTSLFGEDSDNSESAKNPPLSSFIIYIESLRQSLSESEFKEKTDSIIQALSKKGIKVGRLRTIDMVLF